MRVSRARARGETTPNPSVWSDAERAAWAQPAETRPSLWAEKYRVLTRRQSSRPGPWSNRNNPPLAVLMDLCVRRGIAELWIKKAGQIGVSEAIRNVIGCMAHTQPDPWLIVLPDRETGRKIVRKRIIPLFEDTPVLREMLTPRARDKQLNAISLANGCDIQLAWSGSPATLEADPARFVFLDEVDDFDQTIATHAPPAELARTRTTTFEGRSLLIGIGAPTVGSGSISTEFESCPVKLYYFVPCPHCGTFQRLVADNLKWEKYPELTGDPRRHAARVKSRGAAWFACSGIACGKRIEDGHKAGESQILWRGYWATEDQGWKIFTADGHEEGEKPDGEKVGAHLPGFYSLSLSWPKIAGMAIGAGPDIGKHRHVHNKVYAEAWEIRVADVRAGAFAEKCDPATAGPAKLVPKWASRLVLSADTQKDHFYFVLRAYGHGFRSRRIHHGRVTSFEELAQIADHTYWPYEDNVLPATRCFLTGIDSGGGKSEVSASRTDEVYRWCLRDPFRRKPLKGESEPRDTPIRLRKRMYQPPGARRDPYEVWLHLIDSHYFNDLLASAIESKLPAIDAASGEVLGESEGEDMWQLNLENDEEYNRHMANMKKILVRHGRSRRMVERWVPTSSGARVDYRACEVYNLAMAHGPANCGALPTPEVLQKQLKAARESMKRPPTGTRTPDGRAFVASRRK